MDPTKQVSLFLYFRTLVQHRGLNIIESDKRFPLKGFEGVTTNGVLGIGLQGMLQHICSKKPYGTRESGISLGFQIIAPPTVCTGHRPTYGGC